MEQMRFILLEDHPLYREGLKEYILKNFASCICLYDGANFMEAKNVAAKNPVSIAILDLHLGDGRSPGEIISHFSSQDIPVLVVSAVNNFESIKSAFSMGANGFVSKETSTQQLGAAMKSVLRGESWIAPNLSNALFTSKTVADQLSVQERKAVILYASGLKLEAVASRMGIATSTAKQYIDRAKQKFSIHGVDARTKTELYRVLRDEGFLE
jgi:DNA-binding NarL/FixJ family response regulator